MHAPPPPPPLPRCRRHRRAPRMKAPLNYLVTLDMRYISNYSFYDYIKLVDSEVSRHAVCSAKELSYSLKRIRSRKRFRNNNAGTFVYISQKAVSRLRKVLLRHTERSRPRPAISARCRLRAKNKTKPETILFVSVPQHPAPATWKILLLSNSVNNRRVN